MRKPYDAATQKQVVKLYKRGFSMRSITEMEGMPKVEKTVARILRRHEVKSREPGIFDHKAIRRDLIKNPNFTLEEIAAVHDCSIRLVSKIRRELKEERAIKAAAAAAQRAKSTNTKGNHE